MKGVKLFKEAEASYCMTAAASRKAFRKKVQFSGGGTRKRKTLKERDAGRMGSTGIPVSIEPPS